MTKIVMNLCVFVIRKEPSYAIKLFLILKKNVYEGIIIL